MIGYQDAMKLVRAFGGEILYPANCRHVFKQVRDDAMVRMVEMGARIEVVADLFGMTPRAVRDIVAKREKALEDAARRGEQTGADSTEGEHRGL
jgi:Mor family transcriptional regulator